MDHMPVPHLLLRLPQPHLQVRHHCVEPHGISEYDASRPSEGSTIGFSCFQRLEDASKSHLVKQVRLDRPVLLLIEEEVEKEVCFTTSSPLKDIFTGKKACEVRPKLVQYDALVLPSKLALDVRCNRSLIGGVYVGIPHGLHHVRAVLRIGSLVEVPVPIVHPLLAHSRSVRLIQPALELGTSNGLLLGEVVPVLACVHDVCTLSAWQLELLEVVHELVLHDPHQALPVSSRLEGREPGHLIPFRGLRALHGNLFSLHQVRKKVDILRSKAVKRFQIVLHEGLALQVVVFLHIPLGVRELALDIVLLDLHPPLNCKIVLCEQQGNFALLELGVFHTREDGCQSGNEILQIKKEGESVEHQRDLLNIGGSLNESQTMVTQSNANQIEGKVVQGLPGTRECAGV